MAELSDEDKERIRRIPTQTIPLPPEAAVPRAHYLYSIDRDEALVDHFEASLSQVKGYDPEFDPNMRRLYSMILLNFVEAFERFLKELAAVCVDQVGRIIPDDRLDVFTLRGNTLAAHFDGATLGRALCESSTWLDCDQVNRRFRRLLADPFSEGKYQVFPPKTERYTTVEIVLQLRHTLVHNAGVITRSDATRFGLLTKGTVDSPRLLWPNKVDLWSVKLGLDSVVEEINSEVAGRLAELLTAVWLDDAHLFEPAEKARELADLFGIPAAVAGSVANPPED